MTSPAAVLAPVQTANNDSSNSTASSDFFSPISISFFQNNQRKASTPRGSQQNVQRLPTLHDSSWIGARLSPIHSFDREQEQQDTDDDDMDDDIPINRISNEPRSNDEEKQQDDTSRRRMQHQQQQQQQQQPTSMYSDERTRLLLAVNTKPLRAGGSSRIHPLWNSPPPSQHQDPENDGYRQQRRRPQIRYEYLTLGNVVCLISGMNLMCMACYDAYYSYYYHEEDSERSHAWIWPFPLRPSNYTLLQFGAFPFYGRTSSDAEWRHLPRLLSFWTSMLVTVSVFEWMLLVGAWRVVHISNMRVHVLQKTKRRQSPQHPNIVPLESAEETPSSGSGVGLSCFFSEYIVIYIICILTGYLWIWAFDTTSMSSASAGGNNSSGTTAIIMGGASLGTSGVLCAVGMARPLHRFEFFCLASLLVILALFQRPVSSVWGMTGSAFFGWSVSAAGLGVDWVDYVPKHENGRGNATRLVTLTGTIFAILILIVPVFRLALNY